MQLMPEAMDLFQAGVEDRPGVRYQCVATYAPESAVTDWIAALRSPWGAHLGDHLHARSTTSPRARTRATPARPARRLRRRRAVARLLGETPPARRQRRHRPALLAALGRARLGRQGRPPRHRRPLPRTRRPHRLAPERRPLLARALRRGHGPHRRRDAPAEAAARAQLSAAPDARCARSRLNAALIGCRRCPRLVAWREKVAVEKRRAYRDETYWGRPRAGLRRFRTRASSSWASRPARTAPTARGACSPAIARATSSTRRSTARAWRPRPRAVSRDDGLRLRGVFITMPCRCAPPENKPTPAELARCRPFLERELALLPGAHSVLALGKIGYAPVLGLSVERVEPRRARRSRTALAPGSRIRGGGRARSSSSRATT